MGGGRLFAIILPLLILLVLPLAFAACPSNMISYWTFDNAEVSGSTLSDLKSFSDCTTVGATTGQSGILNQSFSPHMSSKS